LDGIRRNDPFITYTKGNISAADYQILSLFYQPIIGAQAYVLYMTLLSLLDRQNLCSSTYLHCDLESLLNIKLDIIEKNRYKLEAIGLLNSYYLNDQFIYEIKLPLSAQSFVNDGVLGQYLIAAITNDRFKKLIEIFKLKLPNKKQYFKISKAFNEVFASIHQEDPLNENQLMSGKKGNSIKVNLSEFDWRLFKDNIPESFFQVQDISDAIKEKINNLAYIYGLDELDMKEVFIKSIDKNKEINLNRLAVEAREQYQILSTNIEKASEKAVEPEIRNIPSDPAEYFKIVSPRALLKEMGEGMVSTADLRIVERLIEEVGLDKGVVNVLLAYIAKIKDGVLPTYDYFQKVGQNWKRNQIDTVELAIDYVRHLASEAEKRKNGTASESKYKKTTKNNRPDIEVDWLEDYMKTIK